MVKMTRSKTFQAYLPSCHRTYSCIHCRAHLANHDELISKSFQGSQGRAYLFNSVVNVGCGPAEERVLLTGLHAVADIYCENCKTTLGWKYVSTEESGRCREDCEGVTESLVLEDCFLILASCDLVGLSSSRNSQWNPKSRSWHTPVYHTHSSLSSDSPLLLLIPLHLPMRQTDTHLLYNLINNNSST
ncbi:protein yippee-like 2 isoform X2 [Mirounga leonina]|uniref:protein yippee-like 2 isoform X2 n=1 Tax=Mirounga leonina TaxID=9715 RepID=UPI00156BFED3|nr:protein yippee-like 2 isoform X2 [Mirounga leonina]